MQVEFQERCVQPISMGVVQSWLVPALPLGRGCLSGAGYLSECWPLVKLNIA